MTLNPISLLFFGVLAEKDPTIARRFLFQIKKAAFLVKRRLKQIF
jgi:hypothetical protein